MSPGQKEKRIKSAAAKARYKITEATRKEKIKVRERRLRSDIADLEKVNADKAIEMEVHKMTNKDIYASCLELEEQRAALKEATAKLKIAVLN